jgi:glyoxylase-like metal-dependent hydrolase (beta-lactamase superfamily II)
VERTVSNRVTSIELPLDRRRTVNAVLVEGSVLTLVDTGLGHEASWAALESGLAARGYLLADIQQIVITHAHTDHFGGAAAVARRSGAPVVADRGGAPILASYPASFQELNLPRIELCREAGAPEELIRQLQARQARYVESGEAVVATRTVAAGDQLVLGDATWQVVETPGHAASEVCFFEPMTRTLLSGDVVLGNGGANVTLYPYPRGRPARWVLDIMDSLEALAALGPERVLPGHGPEIARDAAAEIAARRARVGRRLGEVAGLVRGHHRTAWDVSLAIYPPPVAGTTLGLFQTIGYLEALEATGRVRSVVRGGNREYEG